jgi:hypothetical protein
MSLRIMSPFPNPTLTHVDVNPGESGGNHLKPGWNAGVSSVIDSTQRPRAILPSNDRLPPPGRRALTEGRPLLGCGLPHRGLDGTW